MRYLAFWSYRTDWGKARKSPVYVSPKTRNGNFIHFRVPPITTQTKIANIKIKVFKKKKNVDKCARKDNQKVKEIRLKSIMVFRFSSVNNGHEVLTFPHKMYSNII